MRASATERFTASLDDRGPDRAERLFLLLAGIVLGALVMTNAIAGKFFVLFGQELSCGIIAYPITFGSSQITGESEK